MSDAAKVTLKHPDVKDPITVGAAKAKVLARQGWEPATAAPSRPTPPQEG